MAETSIAPETRAGDPFAGESLRCTDEYIELLSEDFGIPVWVLASAFMGMPRVRKDVALFVCALAEEMPDPARAVIRWAKLGGSGAWSSSSVSQGDA